METHVKNKFSEANHFTCCSGTHFFFITSCTKYNNQTVQPPWPEGVPKESIWIGGLDSGVFIWIIQDNPKKPAIYSAKIYSDTTGHLWYQGRLAIEPTNPPNFDYNNPTLYSGWDGEILYLKDGRLLKAIDEFKPAL